MMAELNIDGDELVVHLTGWERLAAFRGDVRVPLAAVRRESDYPRRSRRAIPTSATATSATVSRPSASRSTTSTPCVSGSWLA